MESIIRLRNSLLAILFTVLAGRWLIYSAGKVLGSYLKRKNAARRQAILRRVNVEEKAVRSFYSRSQHGEDDDWERIESDNTPSAKNGDRTDNDWEGIVGFFHPFWFVIVNPSTQGGTLKI